MAGPWPRLNLRRARVKRKAFKSLLPMYSLQVVAGYCGTGEAVEPESVVGAILGN